MFSLAATFTEVSAAISLADELATDFVKIKPYIAQIMVLTEDTFGTQLGAGATKLQAVLAAGKAVALQIGVSWSSGLQNLVVQAINLAKATWNAVQQVVATVKTTEAGTLIEQAQVLAKPSTAVPGIQIPVA